MKTYKFMMAVLAIALPFSFMACGDDKDDTTSAYEFATPVNKASAATYNFATPDTDIKSVSFGEGNSVIIEKEDENGQTQYIVGTYTKNGENKYSCSVDGQTYEFSITSASGNKYDVSITISGNTVTVVATKDTAISGLDVLCSDWRPFMTKLNLNKKNGGSFTKDDFKGIDFQELKEYAESEGCKINTTFGEGYKVSKVTFYGSGKFSIAFTEGKSYVATWKPKGAMQNNTVDLDFDWKDKESLNNEFLENGRVKATVYTEGVLAGQCWLTLTSTIKNNDGSEWDVEIIFRLIR